MLDVNQPVVALQAERFIELESNKLKKTHCSFLPEGFTDEMEYYGHNEAYGFGAAVIKGICQELTGRKMRAISVVIDQEEVLKRKEQYKDDTFVSTNDVITAFMHDLVPEKLDNIMIPINLRGRIPGVHDNLAGNYLGACVMRKDDLKTPRTVRTWLENVTKPGYKWQTPTWKEVRKYLGGIHTNWSGFYHHVQPEGTTQITHFPVVPEMEYWLMGFLPAGSELDMITYKSNPDEISCFIFTRRSSITKESLLEHPLIKSELIKMK